MVLHIEKKTDKKKRLSELEEACCREYIANGGKKAEAYRTCNKKAEKWKPSTVWVRASELFKKPHVQEYLEELKARAREIADKRLEISVERVLKEFARIAFGDIRKLFSEDGTRLLPPSMLDDDTAAVVSSIDVVTFTKGDEGGDVVEYTHKIKTSSKLQALESLAKYLHLFETSGGKSEEGCRFKGVEVPDWMREMIPNKG